MVMMSRVPSGPVRFSCVGSGQSSCVSSGLVRLGWVLSSRFSPVRFCLVVFRPVWSGCGKYGLVMSGQSCSVESGFVEFGPVMLGQLGRLMLSLVMSSHVGSVGSGLVVSWPVRSVESRHV